MKILLAGVEGVGDALAERLPGLELERLDPADADAAAAILPECAAAVVSLEAYDAFSAADVALDLPVICCLDASTPTDVLRRMTDRGAQRLMFEPVDAAELAREVGRVTGHAAPEIEPEPDPEAAHLEGEIAGLWATFRGTMLERLETLEEVGTLLVEGQREPPALDAARTAAHKLHGSLGTFGHLRGSEIAAELEAIAASGAHTEGDVFRYAELVMALRSELESPEAGPSQPPGRRPAAGGRPRAAVRVLVLEADVDRAEGVTAAALSRGWEPVVVSSFDELVTRLEERPPDLLILDPAAEDTARIHAYLRRLSLYPPRVPVVFWSDEADLPSRLRAAAAGVQAFVERRRDAGTLVARAATLLRESRRPPATVLVVDDDPAILALTRTALDDDTLRVVTIDDPLLFWETAEATSPDLLLLDIDMPHVSGIQLCRVVRASARWAELPIIFFTSHADHDTVTRAFRAGADDYVLKPISGPELRSRVVSRMDRMRLRRDMGAAGPGTGAVARAVAEGRAGMALALAGRHGEPATVALVRVEAEHDGDVRMPLSRLAGMIRDAARAEDVVARWSPCELLVCLYGMPGADADRWLHSRIEPEPHGSWTVRVEKATFPVDGHELDDLLEAAARSSARGVGDEAGASDAGAPRRSGRVDVVLVEDDEALAALLLQTLLARDLSTHWIPDGVEAERMLTGENPSLEGRVILLDIGLPGLDGLTVLRRLAESGVTRRSRVVMLTARAAEAEVLRCLELGAFDHVPKPFSVGELLHRVRRAIDSGDFRT